MTERPAGPLTIFVDDPEDLGEALGHLDVDVVGVDVERADAERYFRRAALVQVGSTDACVLVDGVTIGSLPELDRFLGPDRLAVLHALENDLGPLAAKDVVPTRLADTAVAAALLGLPTGLGPLLQEVLGVELDGDKARFQRADWSARPLTDEMVAYAAGDVVHLPALWSALAERLEASGRAAWYEEELDHVVRRSGENTRGWTRVKGAGRLSDAQRAVLRSLWTERERLAREHDVAPNRLLHDEVLRDVAEDPPRTATQLIRRSQRRRSLVRQHTAALMAAVTRGREAAPEPKPEGGRRWSEADRALHDRLRRRRAEIASEVGIDAGVLCPSQPLWAAIAGDPKDGAELCALAELRGWQTELLAEPLWETYVNSVSRRSEP